MKNYRIVWRTFIIVIIDIKINVLKNSRWNFNTLLILSEWKMILPVDRSIAWYKYQISVRHGEDWSLSWTPHVGCSTWHEVTLSLSSQHIFRLGFGGVPGETLVKLSGGFEMYHMFSDFANSAASQFGSARRNAGSSNLNTPAPHSNSRTSSRVAPPASRNAIRNLSIVQVTSDDLIEETNKECLICLEEQKIGSTACKLACGHLYHESCLKEWLQKSCTCEYNYTLSQEYSSTSSWSNCRINLRSFICSTDHSVPQRYVFFIMF